LNVRPPFRELRVDFAGCGPQDQEIVGGTEARMIQQPQRAPTFAPLESRLQADKFAQRQREALWNRDASLLSQCDLIARCEELLRVAVIAACQLGEGALDGRPHQDREQESRRDRLLFTHALVRALQSESHQLARTAARWRVVQSVGEIRKQMLQKLQAFEQLERGLRAAQRARTASSSSRPGSAGESRSRG